MGMSDLYGPADEAESIATIHAALDAGINLLDTGDYYASGDNEMLSEFEHDENTSPWEAALGWAVDLEKGDFRGRDAVIKLRDERPGRIVSVVLERGEDAATGAELKHDGETIGKVTMSMPSPTSGANLGPRPRRQGEGGAGDPGGGLGRRPRDLGRACFVARL